MGRFFPIVVGMAFAVSVGADEFARRLSEANEFLRDGNPAAAAAIYEDLYVENPDSDIVAYNLGVARHDAAKTAQQRDNAEEAAKQFELAQQAYDKAGSSPRAEVRDAARFNKANTLVEQSQLARAAGDAPGALKGLETAIAEYDAALETAPDLGAAKNNRAHARFLYRQLKQEQEQQEQENQQQQQEQQNSEEQQEGENSEQPQDSQESDDANQQPSDQNQEGGQQDEQQEGESQPQPQDGDSPDQAGEEQEQEDGEPAGESEEEGEESPHSLQEMADANEQGRTPEEEPSEDGQAAQSMAESGGEERPLEQNLEALLQSLADQDHRQQRDDMRQRRPGSTIPREWW